MSWPLHKPFIWSTRDLLDKQPRRQVMTKEQCKVCEGLCCGEIPRLNAEIERLRAEIRSLDQANGGALQEIERLRTISLRIRDARERDDWSDMEDAVDALLGDAPEPVKP